MEHDSSRLDSARAHDLAELPPVTNTHWTTRRKAAVVAAVREGVLTPEEACRRYQLSVEEFTSWQGLVDGAGLSGPRAIPIQENRLPDTGVEATQCPHRRPEPITPAELERQKRIKAFDWNIDARYRGK